MPNVFPPCRNHSRQRCGQRRRLEKNISSAPDAPTGQTDNRARRRHLLSIPILPDLPARLGCSRPKLALARPKLASTHRARLRRATCAAATGLLQTRIAYHDCAAAPRRLLSSVPLSLKTVRCAAAAGRGPRVVFGLQIQPQGDACTGTLLFIFAAHKARMPSRAPPKHFPPFLPFFLPPPLLLLFPPLPAVHKVISEISGTIFFFTIDVTRQKREFPAPGTLKFGTGTRI